MVYSVQRLVVLVTVWSGILVPPGTQAAVTIDNDALNPVNDNTEVWHQRVPRIAVKNKEILACERPSSPYICEEPPNIVSAESTKLCDFRNVRYQEQVYRWVAGRGCLFFTPDFLYVGGSNPINLNAGCFYGNLFAPCLEVAKEDGTCGCYPFDPGLEEVVQTVREAMVPAAQGRWERCFYAASECCEHYMNGESSGNTTECEATYDAWTCWPRAEANTDASQVCSEFAYSGSGPTCNHYSTKTCYANGTWEPRTDYTTCSVTPRLILRFRFYIGVLAFSIASCLPAVFVFFFYKRLRVTRVALHRNLLIAIIFRNIAVIVTRSEIYLDELTSSGDTVMSTHGILCRVLALSERAAGNAVFVCMLVEGIYLHRLIVAVFRQNINLKWLYGIGAVLTVAPVIAWATVMGIHNDHSCWLVYTVNNIQWIIDAPRMVILLVNTGLFIDILRVLLTKIRNSENTNQLNTTKATLFLMPLFGSQFLLTAFRPNTANCTNEQVYFFITYTIEGLQGFIVAMLYCYVNKEVHMLVKSTYKKTETFVSRVRRDSNYRRTTLGHSTDRRFTYSTNLDNQAIQEEVDEERDGKTLPKLHVAEIMSLRTSLQLAEILDPVYETVATVTEGDGLNEKEGDTDSGFIHQAKIKGEDDYGFTNASSVSVDCQDWIRCVSSADSSVYNNSLTEDEIKYLEGKFGNKRITENAYGKICKDIVGNSDSSNNENLGKGDKIANYDNEMKTLDDRGKQSDEEEYENLELAENITGLPNDSETLEDSEILINEIMQIIDKQDSRGIVLDPKVLSPNRKDGNDIIFIED